MRIVGILMVRDGADVVGTCVRYHLALGLERVLVVDNGSSDGTARELESLARTLPVTWASDAGPFRQDRVFSRLAGEAAAAGADWVVPLDADEFWLPARPLHEVLDATAAGALEAPVVNFAQRRGQKARDPRALLTMTMRVAEPADPAGGVEAVDERRLSYIEVRYPPKHVVRATAGVEIGPGNHWVRGAPGDIERTDELVALHAPLRCPDDLALKAEQGRRVEERGHLPDESWHVRRWRKLEDDGALAPDWSANSYLDGRLDVYGHERPLVRDTRLRDAVAPFV